MPTCKMQVTHIFPVRTSKDNDVNAASSLGASVLGGVAEVKLLASKT